MSDDLLARLQAAGSEEERDWLVTEALLESLPAELRQAAWAAAVPHWFDAEILAALLEKAPAECAALYEDLQSLPFVEPFEAREGHNVHEVTRDAMLARLWDERRDEYRTLSARAAAFFAEGDEAEDRIEEIYHQLIADPDAGTEALSNQGWDWHDSPVFAYDLVYALAGAALEHAGAGRLGRRGAGTANLLSGTVDTMYDRYQEAMGKLEAARRASDPGSDLRAQSSFRLGYVHRMLDEYREARARYEEARPIYAAIGDRLGEANCIQALGDVHYALGEYAEARARYEEAQPIYAAIGARLGEANCIRSLGEVAWAEEDWPEAERLLEAALDAYREIGVPYNTGQALRSLGAVAEGRGDRAAAARYYEEALGIFKGIGVEDAGHVRDDLVRVGARRGGLRGLWDRFRRRGS